MASDVAGLAARTTPPDCRRPNRQACEGDATAHSDENRRFRRNLFVCNTAQSQPVRGSRGVGSPVRSAAGLVRLEAGDDGRETHLSEG